MLWHSGRGTEQGAPRTEKGNEGLRRELQANVRDRAAIQHLALFVPWEDFLPKLDRDANEVWRELEQGLRGRRCRSHGPGRAHSGSPGGCVPDLQPGKPLPYPLSSAV